MKNVATFPKQMTCAIAFQRLIHFVKYLFDKKYSNQTVRALCKNLHTGEIEEHSEEDATATESH